MKKQNLSKLELQVMRPFWTQGELTIRQASEELEKLPNNPGYSTVQTIAGRLEAKGALKKTSKIGNAWLFKAAVERNRIVTRMIDELVTLLEGAPSPIISHLLQSKKVSQEDLDAIRKMITENSPDKKGSNHE